MKYLKSVPDRYITVSGHDWSFDWAIPHGAPLPAVGIVHLKITPHTRSPSRRGVAPMNQVPVFREPHYTIDQVAEMWNLSRDSVRRIFLAEPDVPKISRPGNRYKRSYVTLRIPETF